MTRPKIKTALVGVLFVVAFAIVAFSYFAVRSLTATNDNVIAISTNWLPSVATAKEIDTALSDLRVAYLEHLAASDEKTQNEAQISIDQGTARIINEFKNYEALGLDDNDRGLLAGLRDSLSSLSAVGLRFVKFSAASQDDDAKAVLNKEMSPIADKMADLVDQLVAVNKNGATKAATNSAAEFSSTIGITYAAIGGILAIIFGAVWFAISGISRPISKITSAMTKLAGGDTARSVPFVGRADEIGEMASAVEVFRLAAISNKRLEEEAEATRIQTEADRVRLTADAESAAQKRLQETSRDFR